MTIAREFHVLPDQVENEMSEYWFNRVLVLLEAEAIEHKRITSK